MRILFTGGGTGGHIFPIIAVARQLKKNNPDLEMFFLGAPAGAGFSDVLQKEGIRIKTILTGKVRRYFSPKIILDIFKMPIGLIQAFLYLYVWMPDIIFNKGGFGSVPVVLVGWLFRIPILTHESDTIPGLANRLGAMFSKRIAVSFVSTGKYFPSKKTALIGNPIRSAIPMTSEKAKTILGLTSQKPIILILGGSQGAQALNQAILGILPQLLEKYEIVHQCGFNNFEEIKRETSQISSDYHLFPFLNESQMSAAQLLANLVISRAGAGSIAEIAACGKPSILVPLPGSGSDHQKENAFAYAQAGATTVVEEENLTLSIFLNEISQILDNPELSQKMSINAKNFSRPEAAQKIAETLIEMGQ
ncbi:undecaprenyldiphospho-muramoylpentapeptide beta-N-acetylglucosaminyltransferase [Patescibacteria group bacterium]|nr:undecaprenyldiphospho-muramoylpentapeptide beta-N-acetylglucosaminyltransferase [Patescibacteria group bacterium]MBU1563828.1 undecaprenyldiphospho-muramoylpentapeptide beta-N-acetylglucosaminyltransferase [Patescibacteria group bacterium]